MECVNTAKLLACDVKEGEKIGIAICGVDDSEVFLGKEICSVFCVICDLS